MNVRAILRFAVVCPSCGCETLFRAPARTIAEALSAGTQIALSADCCSMLHWFASDLQIEQIREYADVYRLASKDRYLAGTIPPRTRGSDAN